jgi:hypothetical protein
VGHPQALHQARIYVNFMTFRVSADGIHWSKSLDGPIFHKNDGVAWRSARTYTPIVVHDAQGFGGHGPAAPYKM